MLLSANSFASEIKPPDQWIDDHGIGPERRLNITFDDNDCEMISANNRVFSIRICVICK